MSIQLSYLSAIFLLVYFGIGIYIFYFFRKRFHGRFEGQGYKFPAIIYFISVPLIIAIGTNFFNDYNPSQVLTFEVDVMFKIAFLYAILPTIVYISIGLYILSLEYKKGPGYKLPALIYFISVPSLVVIGITMIFGLNYISGRYEQPNKPAGYELYKFLVLKDIIPRSGQSIDEKEEIKVVEKKNENIKEETKVVEQKEEKNDKSLSVISLNNKNNFEEIVKNLSIGETLAYDLSNKNDEEKISASISKEDVNRKLINQEEVSYVSTKFRYEVLDKYNNKSSYTKRTSDKHPKFKVYNYDEGESYYAYVENIDENFSIYETFGKSKFGLFNSNSLLEDNVVTVGLNKSIDDLISNSEIDLLNEKIENKILNKDEATKIVMNNIIAQINFITFVDNTLIYSLTPEEKDKIMPPISARTKKNQENAILHYERGIKKNIENSDFIGLCNNQEKFNSFYKNNYGDKDCLELLFTVLEDHVEADYINEIKSFEEKLISKLNTNIDKELKTDENYYALVIGNNNYQYLEKLDAAENDAKVIADILENKYGFEVELLLNGDYSTTVNSIFNMTKKLKENDNLLIYYAGHGELDKSENRGYWLPVNASTKSRAEWISNQRIVDRVKATKAKHVLLMVDSCFSGSLMRGGELSEENETIDKKYIERLKKKKTRLVITSGGNEPVVDSDGGNHSLFALKLIDTLKNNDNVINSQILFENIRRYVVANADQTPERAMVHKTGHDGGDFLFFPK